MTIRGTEWFPTRWKSNEMKTENSPKRRKEFEVTENCTCK